MSLPNRVGFALLFTITLAACQVSPGPTPPVPSATAETSDTPTAMPSQTPITSPTIRPLTEATPAIVIEPPEPPPTPSPIPPSIGLPDEQLSIFSPGPGSIVTSPIQVSGFGGPSQRDRVRLRLLGEDGRVLSQGYSYLLVLPGNSGRFYGQVPFDIHLVAEASRLEVAMFNLRDTQLSHLTTVDVTLITEGSALVHPALKGAEKLVLLRPRDETLVEGGTVLVQGAGWVDSDLPLTVQLIDRPGNILGSALVEMDAPGVGEVGTYAVDIPYEIPYPQWVRVAVSESSPDIPGILHYTSVLIWLRP